MNAKPPVILLFMALVSLSTAAEAAYIDNFAVGPQSYYLGPGDASAGGSATGLDTNQVAWGARNILMYADGLNGCGFRSIDNGSFSLSVNGSLNVDVAELLENGETPYAPWIYLAYQAGALSAFDWTACDRIVITFSTPPSADLWIETDVIGDNTWYADTTNTAGSQSATILFSSLMNYQNLVFTGTNITGLEFQIWPPMSEAFAIQDIQVLLTPCLNAVKCPSGVTLTWPTNAAGFALQFSTNLLSGFATVTNAPIISGTNFSLTLPCACPSGFFRLSY
jgi:hypothetical protein